MFNSTRNNHSSHRHRRYVSPLERLDQRTFKWKPNKVRENNGYKELCRKGECSIFEPPQHRYFYINRETTIDTLDDLIEYAKLTQEYSIDTESQSRPPPQRPDPALLQIEFVHPDYPSIIVLIEMLHLPEQASISFMKIKELCQVIFSKGHVINSWGEVEEELEDFCRFHLFDQSNIKQIKPKDIQSDFKPLFHAKYPTSPYVELKQNQTYSLQMAVFVTFNEWIDKRMTLADWGCGIDLALGTYKSSRGCGEREDEEEIRRLMTIYAMNDCFGVTKLSKQINTWKLLTPPTTIETEDEQSSIDNKQELIIELHPPHEEWCEFDESIDPTTTKPPSHRQIDRYNEDRRVEDRRVEDRINTEQSTRPSERRMVHVSNEPDEDRHSGQSIESNASMHVVEKNDDRQRRTTVNHQFDRKQHRCEQQRQQQRESTMVHVLNEPNEVGRKSRLYLETEQTTTASRTKQQIKNRIANNRRRAKRYRFEVTRQIYRSFTITKVKRILKSMNIDFVNINIVRHMLFIGLKSKAIVQKTEEQLHDRIFTEQHYRRLYTKNERQNFT